MSKKNLPAMLAAVVVTLFNTPPPSAQLTPRLNTRPPLEVNNPDGDKSKPHGSVLLEKADWKVGL